MASAAALFAGPVAAQSFPTDNPVLRRMWQEGMEHSQVYPLAQALLDSIGPRLTGSPALKAGSDWLIATYRSWGITARAEPYGTWRGWRRGKGLLNPRVCSTSRACVPGPLNRCDVSHSPISFNS